MMILNKKNILLFIFLLGCCSDAIGDDELDENIADMNTDAFDLLDSNSEGEVVFSAMKESSVNIFDENILEEELRTAEDKPVHTPWTLVGVGLGVAVVVVGGVLLVVKITCLKKKKSGKVAFVDEADFYEDSYI